MESTCPRCGAPLLFADHAAPLFCGECGLPQLRVSEGALGEGASAAPPADTAGEVEWPRALRVLMTFALLGAVLPCLLPGALTSGAVAGVALLLTPALALGAMYAYGRRRAVQRSLSTRAGARMGAVLGLLMGCLIAFATGVAGFVLRYGYRSHVMDDTISQAIGQLPNQISSQMVPAGPPPELLTFIASPEFRAGSFIAGHVFTLLLLVGAASVCGLMSAAILRTRGEPDAG